MRQKASLILIFLLFTAGLCILLYPFVCNYLNDRNQTTVIEEHSQTLAQLDTEEIAALWEAAEAYNKGLLGNVILTDPFDERIAAEASEQYNSLLNVNGDGIMGSIRIPKIDVKLAIYHGTSHEVLEKGAGHVENTSLPIGGTGTHAVISAHSALPTAILFTNLSNLVEGDLFFVDILTKTLAYRVEQIKIVEPDNTKDLLIDKEKDYITLVTCTPYGINSHRLLVRGAATEYAEALEEEAAQAREWSSNWPHFSIWFILALAFIIILILYIAYKWWKSKKSGPLSP